jgi:osmotically-inducible protein OsmY
MVLKGRDSAIHRRVTAYARTPPGRTFSESIDHNQSWNEGDPVSCTSRGQRLAKKDTSQHRTLRQKRNELMVSDLQLRQDVLDELKFEPSINAAQIGVTAESSVVTLTGHVGTYAEKYQAVKAARRIKGVRGLADEIEVRYGADKKTSDDEIAKRALAILNWDTMVPSAQLQVMVRDGWVTLSGDVDWQYQRRSAEQDIRKLSGVRGVTNSISIKPHVQSYEIKQKIEDALKRHAEVEARAISVRVENGNDVILEGQVDNWDERYAVENAAWSAPGVKSVDARLTIS